MRFGLEEHIILQLIHLFEQQPKIDKAIVFGSRAKGNHKPGSDIDIAFKGTDLNTKDILNLYVKWDDLEIPFKLDLLKYETIKEPALKDHIDRVGIEFYSRWKEFHIEDLAEILNQKRVPLSSMVRSKRHGIFPYYGASGIIDYVDDYIFDGEHVLISEDGENLKSRQTPIAFLADGKFWVNNHAHIVKGVKPFYNKLIKYYFQNLDLNPYLTGAVQPKLNKAALTSIPLYIPSDEKEQITIASILTSLDDKIDLLNRQNKTLEQLAETLFRQWFVEEVEEGWEEKKLGELLTITSSKRIFYSEYVSFGVPFYRSKEIIELRNSGSTNCELYISNERFDEINNKFGSPKEGDILMTSVGTLGVAYKVRKSDKFYFKDGNLTWFKDFKGLPSSIIYLWLISKIGQEELAAITIGSTQEALTIEGLKRISFKIPPQEKIKIYEIEFNSIIEKIESNQTQICTLNQTRDTLLPKLMNGEVRVKL